MGFGVPGASKEGAVIALKSGEVMKDRDVQYTDHAS